MKTHILSALYAANSALQHWLDVTGDNDGMLTSITQKIDVMRVSVEHCGFSEFAREQFRNIALELERAKTDNCSANIVRFMIDCADAL